jgi:phytoene dehydrogenase-like protein
LELECERLVANLTPWGLARLLGEEAPARLQAETARRAPTWGAFTLYVGLPDSALPPGLASHHQVVLDPAQPLGEGNSIFLSISEPDDPTRAPAGQRAITISTHTQIAPWWNDRAGYAGRKEDYTGRVLAAAETVIPGIAQAARLILPGTPVTFQFYTRRPGGMVGGFPQMSLLAARGPATGLRNAWLVGDSVFPGQSTAGVTIGAMRVAASILENLD